MLWLVCVVVFHVWCATAAISCSAGDGTAREWWFIYKYPRSGDYLYIDNTLTQWTANSNVNDAKSPLWNTISTIAPQAQYKSNEPSWVAYNDQAGTCASATDKVTKYQVKATEEKGVRVLCAHSKGFVSNDNQNTVYISHSQPNFPCVRTWTGSSFTFQSFLPESATNTRYAPGQHYACFTFEDKDLSAFLQIMKMLLVEKVNIVRSNFILDGEFTVSAVNALLKSKGGKDIIDIEDEEKCFYSFDLKSASMDCTFFVKYGTSAGNDFKGLPGDLYQKDMWAIVQQKLGDMKWIQATDTLWAQSWKSFGDGLSSKSATSGHYMIAPDDTVEIITAHSGFFGIAGQKQRAWFTHYFDHSKWAISNEAAKTHIVCISGSNREFSQTRRGGEALCVRATGSSTFDFYNSLLSTILFVQPKKGNPAYAAKFNSKFKPNDASSLYMGAKKSIWDTSKTGFEDQFVGMQGKSVDSTYVTYSACPAVVYSNRVIKSWINDTYNSTIDQSTSVFEKRTFKRPTEVKEDKQKVFTTPSPIRKYTRKSSVWFGSPFRAFQRAGKQSPSSVTKHFAALHFPGAADKLAQIFEHMGLDTPDPSHLEELTGPCPEGSSDCEYPDPEITEQIIEQDQGEYVPRIYNAQTMEYDPAPDD